MPFKFLLALGEGGLRSCEAQPRSYETELRSIETESRSYEAEFAKSRPKLAAAEGGLSGLATVGPPVERPAGKRAIETDLHGPRCPAGMSGGTSGQAGDRDRPPRSAMSSWDVWRDRAQHGLRDLARRLRVRDAPDSLISHIHLFTIFTH